jgi:hypothetical protein
MTECTACMKVKKISAFFEEKISISNIPNDRSKEDQLQYPISFNLTYNIMVIMMIMSKG